METKVQVTSYYVWAEPDRSAAGAQLGDAPKDDTGEKDMERPAELYHLQMNGCLQQYR